MTDGMIYHGVRKQELLKIIERSGLNFEEATSNFGFADNTRNPLSLILGWVFYSDNSYGPRGTQLGNSSSRYCYLIHYYTPLRLMKTQMKTR